MQPRARHAHPTAVPFFALSCASAVLTAALVGACGQTEGAATSSPDATADGPTASTTDDAQASVATVDGSADATSVVDAGCVDGGAAPDGGACDWSRVRTGGIASSQCIAIGRYCDDFMFTFSPAEDGDPSLPPSFTCSTELGVKTCRYAHDTTGVTLDVASLGAACDVTRVLPKVVVTCAVYE